MAVLLSSGLSIAQNLPSTSQPAPQETNSGLVLATPMPKTPESSAAQPSPTDSNAAQVQGTNAVAAPTPVAPSQGTSSEVKTALNGPSGQSDPQLVIGSGDLLEVSVFGANEYTKQVRVSDSGEVTLPFINAVKVAGLTIEAAEQAIGKLLSDGGYFKDPQVSVVEKEYATQGISVLGEVQKPGIYPLLGPRMLLEAISAAGGITPRAGRTVTITHRNDPQHPQVVPISYDNQSANDNVRVFPGDTVAVSRAGVVYVVGDVKLPTGVIMDKAHVTVLQAIAMAQGTNPTASLDRSMIIRKTSDGQQEIPIPLKKILSAQAPDVKLQAEDIIFVPTSTAKTAGRRTLEAVIQTATGLAIYRR